MLQEKQEEKKKKRQVLPENIKKEVAYHALKYGIREARKWACKKNPSFTFATGTVSNLKTKYQRSFLNKKEGEFFAVSLAGQFSIISDELASKVMAFLHNLHASGGAIFGKTASVIAIGNGVLCSRCPEKIANNGGNVTLTITWA